MEDTELLFGKSVRLAVPLPVSISVGKSWSTLTPYTPTVLENSHPSNSEDSETAVDSLVERTSTTKKALMPEDLGTTLDTSTGRVEDRTGQNFNQ